MVSDTITRIRKLRRRLATIQTPKTPKVDAEWLKGFLKEQNRKEFVESYKPEKSFSEKLTSDLGIFLQSLPKIPGALWHTGKQTLTEAGAYDIEKPLWSQFEGLTAGQARQRTANMGKTALATATPLNLMYLPYMEKIKPLEEFKKKIGFEKTPATSGLINKLIAESMIKGTGSWIYDPEPKRGNIKVARIQRTPFPYTT